MARDVSLKAMRIDGGSVSTISSRALIEACERLGVESDSVLDAAGVERSVLADPDAHLPSAKVAALWAKAYEAAGDPDLALHAAEALPFGACGVIEFLAWNAPTIGQALTQVSDYFPIINNSVALPIDAGADEVTIGFEDLGGWVSRPYAEFALAVVVLRTRDATSVRWPISEIDFAFPAPASIEEHQRIFDCPVRFGATRTQLRIDRTVWDTPSTRADPNLFAVLEQHARNLLDKVADEPGTTAAARHAISDALKGGDPSLEGVAKKLGMSPRTVQRRLKEEGWVFAELLDEMRKGTAQGYLQQPNISLAEVAYLLGFSEQSSFTRAFKRWTGATPKEFRKSVQQQA